MIELKNWLGIPLSESELVAFRVRRARGRQYAYLGPDVALTQLYDGQFIFIDPQDEQVSAPIIAQGYWEPWVEAAVKRMLHKGDRVAEVGANVGYYTLIMARRVGPAGHIYSFEANPHLARLLRRSVDLNLHGPYVDIFQAAASNAAGPVTFMTSRRSSGGGHIQAGAADLGPETLPVEVQATTLDTILPFGEFDFLRLDAEGSEPLILQGSLGMIRRSPRIKICMEWDRVQMSSRADVGQLVDGLVAAGLKFWKIELDATLSPLTPAALLTLPHSDIVAARVQPF